MEGSANEARAQPAGWTARAADRSWTLIRRIHLATRRPANWVQLFKFGIVGATGYAVNLVVFALLTGAFDVHHIAAAVGAFCVAVTNNFIWNRAWTFRHRRDRNHAALQGARFLMVSLAALIPNLIILDLLVRAGMGKVVAQVIAVCVVVPISFLGNRLWSFR